MNRYQQRMQEITRKFAGSFEPQQINNVSEADLDVAEREIGYPLPSDYREFLRHYGEFFVATGIDTHDPESEEAFYGCTIESFYGVNAQHPEKDLVKQYHWLSRLTPPGLLRLGIGEGGFVALALAGEHKGTIYFVVWPNDSEKPNEIRQVADSFDDFMNLLTPAHPTSTPPTHSF